MPKIEIIDAPILKIHNNLTATLYEDYSFVVDGEIFTIPKGEVTDYVSYLDSPPFLRWLSMKVS